MLDISDSLTEKMLKSGFQFGYSKVSRHPKMKPFIFASKIGVEIFDLEKIKAKLDAAKKFLRELGKEKKTIIFVSTKRGTGNIVEEFAQEINMPYVTTRWIGGTLTNFNQIKKQVDYLNELLIKRENKENEKYTKKERLLIDRKIAKMEKLLAGLKNYPAKPSALLIIDSKHEEVAVKEARQEGIPVVALLNSDCNPDLVDYPVPGNDSSVSSVRFFLEEMVKAYKEGLKDSQN